METLSYGIVHEVCFLAVRNGTGHRFEGVPLLAPFF